MEGISLGTVKKKKYDSDTLESQYLGSHFITKDTVLNSTQLEGYSKTGTQTKDSQRSTRNSQFQNYAGKPRPLQQTNDVSDSFPPSL